MKAIDEYIKHMSKCNNQCPKHNSCLRYNRKADDNLMENRSCRCYFEKKDDTLNQLKNIFGMR
jgi:hypothetical protein